MDLSTLGRFRSALLDRRDGLLNWFRGGTNDVEVHLGGCEAQDCKVIEELDTAIASIDHGEFGHCKECDGDVELERLELDFTASVCLECLTDRERGLLERDLELAAKVQQELFPSAVPALPTMDIAAHSKPARVVGGDYYDFFSFRDGSQGIVIADVMGKGLSASMLMSNVQASLRILGPQFDEPCDLALRLNELFRFNVAMSRFISLIIVAVDVDENRIRYINAGHNPGLLLRANTGRIEELRPTGPAIGLTREPPMEAREVLLGAGDLLLLYTDGLVESRNGDGGEYGVERLQAFLTENHDFGAEQFSARLWRDFDAYTGGRRLDDVTTVVLKATS